MHITVSVLLLCGRPKHLPPMPRAPFNHCTSRKAADGVAVAGCAVRVSARIIADGAMRGQAVAENAKPVAEDLMQNQVKPAMVDAAATAEETSQVLAHRLLPSPWLQPTAST